MRNAEITRKTKETDIFVNLNLDGTGKSEINTGIGFFDHMLEGFSKHGFFDLTCKVTGDLNVDGHHTIEDTGIVLGNAIKEAIRTAGTDSTDVMPDAVEIDAPDGTEVIA